MYLSTLSQWLLLLLPMFYFIHNISSWTLFLYLFLIVGSCNVDQFSKFAHMYSIKSFFWPMASQNHYKCFAKLLQLLCKTILCHHGYLSYFFNFLIVGSYNFNHICQNSFISILLWSKYISLKILPCSFIPLLIICQSYFFNFLIVGSYNFDHIFQYSFISILF